MSNQGFMYIATGRSFIDEARQSAVSLKRHMPSARTCCFTDDPAYARGSFDLVELIEKPYRNFFEKIPPLSLTPFDQTIFIDTDTIFADSMMDVFDLLGRFELAAVSDPFACVPAGMPPCFSHINTGLIAYNNTANVKAFFADWFAMYQEEFAASGEKSRCHDQMSFQRTLYDSKLRFYVLPGEYNFRVVCPQMARIWAKVKMLHARHPDLVKLGEQLNSEEDVRVVWPNLTHFFRTNLHMIDHSQSRIFRFPHRLMARMFKLTRLRR